MIVVMVSGGITSFEVLRRVVSSGRPCRALFADVKMEDGDTYRFLADTERVLGVKIETTSDGRNPWELFRDRRFIGKPGASICSLFLKRMQCVKWMREHEPNGVVALGLDWTEPHRIEHNRERWKKDGFETTFPLAEPPYHMKNEYMGIARDLGIEPPRLYAEGFEHNNCGGGCVMGGQAQWAKLLRTRPESYRWHEKEEELTRQVIGKNVSILRDRRGGKTKPLTLKSFRERIEQGDKPQDDLFSCRCMDE